MTTVAEMIEWLKTLPQDAVVECGKEVTSGYSTYMTHDAVDIECSYVFDYSTDDMREKYPKMGGRKFVHLSAE